MSMESMRLDQVHERAFGPLSYRASIQTRKPCFTELVRQLREVREEQWKRQTQEEAQHDA